MKTRILTLLALLPLLAGAVSAAPRWDYRVVARYPHDPAAFTQGLTYVDGVLYEGTGQRGESSLRVVELETGAVLDGRGLDPELFGEGIAVLGDRIVQLTWTSGVGLVYERESLREIDRFTYRGQGWGLAHDAARDRLVMSDGGATLRFLDPVSLAETGRVRVTDADRPVPRLNELEVVGDRLFANVWPTDRIAVIDLSTGVLLAWLDLSPLRKQVAGAAEALNGIALDPATGDLLVTGKYWPALFRLELRIPAAD